MKRKQTLLLLLFTCISLSVFSQVGINTTSPKDGSLLDIESTEKGIFIPKVDIADLSTIAPITGVAATVPALAAAEGLLVYNTNGTTGEGYYFWSGTQWVALAPVEDGDFHQVTTTNAPTAITQDVFRTGNVAIGKTTADYPLDIDNTTSTRTLDVNLSGATDAQTYAIYATNENTSDNHHHGIYSLVRNNTGTGNRYGIYTNVQIPGTQTNQAYGIYNNLTAGTGGNGAQIGTFNRLGADGVFRAKTGVSNYITGTDSATQIGVNNNIAHSGTGTHIGTQNQMRGSGAVKGVYNTFNNLAGAGLNRGVENQMTNDGNGTHQGLFNSLSGDGSGDHIGVSNFISGAGNGNHSGVINTITGTGNGEHVGVYNNINNSTGNNWGFRNEIDNTANLMTSYGTYNNLIGSDVGGTAIAGYFSSTGAGTNYAAIFENGNVGIGTATPNATLDVRGTAIFNEDGANADFRVESDNETHMLFVDASSNEVGIGTNNPRDELEVVGTIRFSNQIRRGGTIYHPDHVFESYYDGFSIFNPDYKVQSLNEVEAFVKKNKHLPGVQSRADVLENDWNMSEGVRVNLEKVEELFLHTIEASKKIETLQTENSTLKNQLNQAIDAIEALQKRLSKLEKQN